MNKTSYCSRQDYIIVNRLFGNVIMAIWNLSKLVDELWLDEYTIHGCTCFNWNISNVS